MSKSVFSLYFSLGVIIIPLFIAGCQGPSEKNAEKMEAPVGLANERNSDIHIDLKSILDRKDTSLASTVDVSYDHFFKKRKKYKGYAIKPLMDSLIKAHHFDTTKAFVVFECTDGYMPIMDVSKVLGKVNGYFTFRDQEQGLAKAWPDSVNEKFHPYYLVWDNVKKEDQSYMWPFGLVALRLVSIRNEFKSVYPFNDTSRLKGFYLFRDNCMKCHAINKVGGMMGPELNIPKNIMEYWQEKDIIAFTKNPASYRVNSRMPAITNLNNDELHSLLSYLKYMKDHKIKLQ